MTSYAAARAAEQVSFGPTPELVAELSQKGLSAWLDEQLAMPATQTSAPSWVTNFNVNNDAESNKAGNYPQEQFWLRALAAPDQLRQRVVWALFQYIPVAMARPYGHVQYHNMLAQQAFGNYADLLRAVTIHPMMGFYLNNNQNRPVSPQCLGCTPNENYARELMQLFTVGVVKLNLDGSTQRDSRGKPLETYSQKDVEELARALTGWKMSYKANLPSSNDLNYGENMVPEDEAYLHDSGSKTVMGESIAAGMGASAELDAVVALLMKHPNTAPFVSLRLIQHLVTSNPSPPYLSRVAATFQNNGQGVAGDMKAVIKSILLDPEARRADVPGQETPGTGKLKEPVLWYSALLRGLGCTRPLYGTYMGNKNVNSPQNQNPDNPPSIFSFYQATDRAPGSNLLAPEQKLLNTIELRNRIGGLHWPLLNTNNPDRLSNRNDSGCQLSLFAQAFSESPTSFINLVSQRWFRGAMPPTLRQKMQDLMLSGQGYSTAEEGALNLLQFALTSPYFGVMK
jgi:uncharacterized protein (DUF1800 family)